MAGACAAAGSSSPARPPTLVELQQLADDEDPPCRQYPDLFFNATSTRDTKAAKQMCWDSCDIREQCELYALAARERYGVWGGRSSPDGHLLNSSRAGRLGV